MIPKSSMIQRNFQLVVFYDPKCYGDTSIFDGPVSYTHVLRVVRILRSALIFLL